MLESVETYDDLAAAILKFDEERFGYADMHDIDLAPNSISDDIDFSKDYFTIYNSDYLYIKNASNKDCIIIAKNEVKQTIKPGEIQIWNYGNLVALDDEVLEELELDDNEKKFVYGEQQKETEESSFDDRLRVIFEECDSLLENLPKGLTDDKKEILPPVVVLWSALEKYLKKQTQKYLKTTKKNLKKSAYWKYTKRKTGGQKYDFKRIC